MREVKSEQAERDPRAPAEAGPKPQADLKPPSEGEGCGRLLGREPRLLPWKLVYDTLDLEREPLREALCTLANGVFGVRGAAEETTADDPGHYPGIYVAGGFDRAETEVAGRIVQNEDLVNWPSWLGLTFRPEGGAWFHVDRMRVLDFRQELDLRAGELVRRLCVRDDDGRETELTAERFVDMSRADVAGLRWRLVPLNWSGTVMLRATIDGSVRNAGVARYRALSGRHLEITAMGQADESDGEVVYLAARSLQSRLVVAQAVRTRVVEASAAGTGETATPVRRTLLREPERVGHLIEARCTERRGLRIEKTLCLRTSRDPAISEPLFDACAALDELGSFDELRADHRFAWERNWRRIDVELPGQPEAQTVLRLHLFHLLQTTAPSTIDRDVGVPARGLHGEAYRGHIFWDELFILPLLDLTCPELSRSLLLYRYRRLGAARRAARAAGLRGAMFPWQSGSSGREESQRYHLNPRSGRWVPDDTLRQRHIGAAVAWNVWRHYTATGELEMLASYGAEMLAEVARFWASLARRGEDDRFHICGVVGPDEFHTRYPGAPEDRPGVDDNAYTNVMAAWCLRAARRALELIGPERRDELARQLEIDGRELARWDEVARRMHVPFLREQGLIAQFAGYEELAELPWDDYRARHADVHRLDRILEAEGDDINRFKASKQADVLMLFYLFSADELRDLLGSMGYELPPDDIPRAVRYYLERTSHGSTLSRVVHAWVLARSDRERSWSLFCEALRSDVHDTQGGTTAEGIHLGAMAGTVDLVRRCYTGIELRDDVLWIDPALPDELAEVRLRVRYRSRWLAIRASREELAVRSESGCCGPVDVGFAGEVHAMESGDERRVRLRERGDARS